MMEVYIVMVCLLQMITVLLFTALVVGAADHPASERKTSRLQEKKADVESVELIWSTLRDRYWDSTMGGLDWPAIHIKYKREVEAAQSSDEAREDMAQMLQLLPSSHLAIIPGSAYRVPAKSGAHKETTGGNLPKSESDEDNDESGSMGLDVAVIGSEAVVGSVEKNSPAFQAGVRSGWIIQSVDGKATKDLFPMLRGISRTTPELLVGEVVRQWLAGPVGSAATVMFISGKGENVTRRVERGRALGESVSFGNLPPERVWVEHRQLESGVGYLRLNLFLDPVMVMPEIQKAVDEFKDAPGIVFDLRDNPGGIGVMAMGIAGWFVADEGMRLGTMTMRDLKIDFTINPRLDAYGGRVAILVNGGSASTTEILAQGLRDLGRARLFGTRTAGAALPSNVIRLPNGDRFQYPEASYVSMKGRVLEGNGVEPDVVVAPTVAGLLAGHDLPLETAENWSAQR